MLLSVNPCEVLTAKNTDYFRYMHQLFCGSQTLHILDTDTLEMRDMLAYEIILGEVELGNLRRPPGSNSLSGQVMRYDFGSFSENYLSCFGGRVTVESPDDFTEYITLDSRRYKFDLKNDELIFLDSKPCFKIRPKVPVNGFWASSFWVPYLYRFMDFYVVHLIVFGPSDNVFGTHSDCVAVFGDDGLVGVWGTSGEVEVLYEDLVNPEVRAKLSLLWADKYIL